MTRRKRLLSRSNNFTLPDLLIFVSAESFTLQLALLNNSIANNLYSYGLHIDSLEELPVWAKDRNLSTLCFKQKLHKNFMD
jgi:hypothetical protein